MCDHSIRPRTATHKPRMRRIAMTYAGRAHTVTFFHSPKTPERVVIVAEGTTRWADLGETTIEDYIKDYKARAA